METNDIPLVERCACELLEVVPVMMRHIRSEMRISRGSDLTVPQFRTLAYLTTNAGASLSDLAEYIGLTLPSASKLVDNLVAREMVQREVCAKDRRRMILTLTANGRAAWSLAYQAAKAYLTRKLLHIPEADQKTIDGAMLILRPLFLTESH